jgi:hypothetical protein
VVVLWGRRQYHTSQQGQGFEKDTSEALIVCDPGEKEEFVCGSSQILAAPLRSKSKNVEEQS